MTHLEQITRAAARAMGHQAASWTWNDAECALVETVGLHDQWATFSPLRDGGDAFTLEALLQLDVIYTADDKHTQIAVMRKGTPGSPTFVTLLPSKPMASVAMRERMRAVTQFAAILDQMGEGLHE